MYLINVLLIFEACQRETNALCTEIIFFADGNDKVLLLFSLPWGDIHLSLDIVPTFFAQTSRYFSEYVCVSAHYHSTLMTEPFHSGRKGLPVHSLTVLSRVECVCMCVRLPLRLSTELRKAKSNAQALQFFFYVSLNWKKACFVKDQAKLFYMHYNQFPVI